MFTHCAFEGRVAWQTGWLPDVLGGSGPDHELGSTGDGVGAVIGVGAGAGAGAGAGIGAAVETVGEGVGIGGRPGTGSALEPDYCCHTQARHR